MKMNRITVFLSPAPSFSIILYHSRGYIFIQNQSLVVVYHFIQLYLGVPFLTDRLLLIFH